QTRIVTPFRIATIRRPVLIGGRRKIGGDQRAGENAGTSDKIHCVYRFTNRNCSQCEEGLCRNSGLYRTRSGRHLSECIASGFTRGSLDFTLIESTLTSGMLAKAKILPQDVVTALEEHVLIDGNRHVIDLQRSRGCHFVDQVSGRTFLDLYGFYGSLPVGYNHPHFKEPSVQRDLLEAACT